MLEIACGMNIWKEGYLCLSLPDWFHWTEKIIYKIKFQNISSLQNGTANAYLIPYNLKAAGSK